MQLIRTGIFVLLAWLFATETFATEHEWQTIELPAFGEYILSFEQPTEWVFDKSYVRERGFKFPKGQEFSWFNHSSSVTNLFEMDVINKQIGFTPGSVYHAGNASFVITHHDLPQPVTLERWVEVKKASWKDTAMIVYEEGATQLLGNEAFYYFDSPETTYKDGKEVPATGPTRKNVIVVVNDDVLLEIEFGTRYYTEQFEALLLTFERMLNSIKVTSVADIDPSQISISYASPEIRASQRRDYTLDVSISLVLPPGWSATKPELKNATAVEQKGRMVIEFLRMEDLGGPSFMVFVEGMPPDRPLEPEDFLATADRLIDELMPEHGPGQTIETDLAPQFFCMGHMKNRYWTGTGAKAYVRSYEGIDATGRSVKAQVYTAGGFSAACNLIYVNETDKFDEMLPDIEAMIGSINSSEYSPAFLR